jgi:hypothetical protein
MKQSESTWVRFLLLFALLVGPLRAEDFGDISVSPNAIYTGNTYHGYAEMRLVVANRSLTRTHFVTLIYPNNDYHRYGNSISRLSRTVSLAPDAREVVALLQPPLPSQGDGSIRVEVDGRHEGEVRAPNANNHCNYYSRGGGQMATVFVSRSLDYDGVAHLFEATIGAFTASKAVGPPDAAGGGYQPNCWMPDTRSYGRTNWLDLDFATPQTVNRIIIYHTQPAWHTGSLLITGASGTNLTTLPFGAGFTTSASPGWQTEFTLPPTKEPVKALRLDFAKTPPHMIAIDAVQISGPGGSQYASAARASSDNSASAGAYIAGRGTVAAVESIRAESPVSEWSENWLAYSPFDAVVMNDADVAGLTPPVFAALGSYVQAGGNLVVIGRGDLPAAWHATRAKKLHSGKEFEIGFGHAYAFTPESPSGLDSVAVQRLRDAVRDTARYFQSLPSDYNAANSVMPVVENVKIPTRGIVIVMLLFVILIGPVNMIYLNRIKRRTWMLWTIPAISFATTLLVFAYSLLREGVTPDTRIQGLTMLDQTSHQAATIGGEAFYCPLTPSGGLHFEFGTEATPLVNVDFGSGTEREVDWTQSQHFQRGWVSARVPEHFHLRKAETRRERIQVVSENGKLQIINSLGAPIKSLWFADADLNVYQAANIAAGDKGGLIPARQLPSGGKSGPNGLLRDLGFSAPSAALTNSAGGYLLPNTYIAVLDGNPFIENALGAAASPKRTKSSAVVFGVLDAAETVAAAK